MKKAIYILFGVLFPLLNFGQVTNPVDVKKMQFVIRAGAHYKTFLGNKYIEPTPYGYADEYSKHQYERFTKIPTWGFSTGLLVTYRLNEHWGLTSGLQYFLKKDVFENNQDTVIKYGNGSYIRDIHNTLKYDYTYHNIEVPLLFQYSAKKITFYAGCYFALITYKKATYTYVINQLPQTPQWTSSSKTISGWEIPLKFFPTIQASYEVQLKKIKFSPYIAFYYAVKNQNDIYTQLGINFPIVKNQNQKL
jgi:hypothetical protein